MLELIKKAQIEQHPVASNPKVKAFHEKQISGVADGSAHEHLEHVFGLFDIIHEFTNDLDVVRRIAYEAVMDFAEDGVVYLELRTTPRKVGTFSRRDYVIAVRDGMQRAAQDTVGFINAYLLLSINRNMSSEQANSIVDLANEFKGPWVIGVDLSGNPNLGNFQIWKGALERAREYNIPLTLHCGEVDNEEEVLEMIRFKPHRLGHVIVVPRSPVALRELLRSGIPVELCLSSNVHTKSVTSYEDHHIKIFMEQGHPLSICTDDMGVFETCSSREHHLAAGVLGLSQRELFQLSKRSASQIMTGSQFVHETRRILDIFREAEAKLLGCCPEGGGNVVNALARAVAPGGNTNSELKLKLNSCSATMTAASRLDTAADQQKLALCPEVCGTANLSSRL